MGNVAMNSQRRKDLDDLRRYQLEYFTASNTSDVSSMKSAIEFLRGERPLPNRVFYIAQELIQDLKEYQGMSVSDITQVCNISPSVVKRLSSGDFRSVTYLHTVRLIRFLEPMAEGIETEGPTYTFIDQTSKRERRRKRKLKKSQK